MLALIGEKEEEEQRKDQEATQRKSGNGGKKKKAPERKEEEVADGEVEQRPRYAYGFIYKISFLQSAKSALAPWYGDEERSFGVRQAMATNLVPVAQSLGVLKP